MCGIFGLTICANSKLDRRTVRKLINTLFKLSESRGKESAGIHIYLPESRKSWTIKSDQPATTFIRSSTYRKNLDEALNLLFNSSARIANQSAVFIAHSRLVTNGSAQHSENNQPVTCGDTTVIHNGIVVNVDDIWASHSNLQRQAEVDTEVIAALLDMSLQSAWDPIVAMQETFAQLKGSASIAWTHARGMFVGAGTNTGDLFCANLLQSAAYVFASEQFILETALQRSGVSVPSTNVGPNQGFVIALESGCLQFFNFDSATEDMVHPVKPKISTTPLTIVSSEEPRPRVAQYLCEQNIDEKLLRYKPESLLELKRCKECILPVTFPFIEFDSRGVCNYCNSYIHKYKYVDEAAAKRAFLEKIEGYRTTDGRPDVIVPLSGGRDSCYGLHLLKREFGLNPITFTYDWGMVTDLARRNIARICGELGVQNILVSADIVTKRRNIRKNVLAWLKRPDLGLVPLFMAGDKQFFSVVNSIRKQTGIKLNVWSANPLENTDFKSGFCGVPPAFDKTRLDYLSVNRRLQMLKYYGKAFVANPTYLNSSLADTTRAFGSYYFAGRKDQLYLFNDVVWRENHVDSLLGEEYEFELSPESTSTWRIGDGTAAFYNYIYVTARGFSEFDALRSNQIREGHISRDDALTNILAENAPRPISINWYLSTLVLDFDSTVGIINQLDEFGLHA